MRLRRRLLGRPVSLPGRRRARLPGLTGQRLDLSSRDSGPRRYDSVQRVSNTDRRGSCTLCSRNMRFVERRQQAIGFGRDQDPPAAPSSPSSTRALSRSVCSRPRNQVPVFASPL